VGLIRTFIRYRYSVYSNEIENGGVGKSGLEVLDSQLLSSRRVGTGKLDIRAHRNHISTFHKTIGTSTDCRSERRYATRRFELCIAQRQLARIAGSSLYQAMECQSGPRRWPRELDRAIPWIRRPERMLDCSRSLALVIEAGHL